MRKCSVCGNDVDEGRIVDAPIDRSEKSAEGTLRVWGSKSVPSYQRDRLHVVKLEGHGGGSRVAWLDLGEILECTPYVWGYNREKKEYGPVFSGR